MEKDRGPLHGVSRFAGMEGPPVMTEYKKLTARGITHVSVEQEVCLMAPLGDYDRTKIIRCVCISDTHLQHETLSLPAGDILIHCGDIMQDGENMSEIESFLVWIKNQSFTHKLVIAGNHDRMLDIEQFADKLKDCAKARKALKSVCTYLEDSHVMVEGYCFYGTPWTASCLGWGFAMARGAPLIKVWKAMQSCPTSIDVLLTHGPPLGVLDGKRVKVGDADLLKALYSSSLLPSSPSSLSLSADSSSSSSSYFVSEKENLSSSLSSSSSASEKANLSSCNSSLESDEKLDHSSSLPSSSSSSIDIVPQEGKVRVHVFGHVHDSRGIATDGSTLFINAAICDRHTRAVHPPIVFDLPRRS